MSGARTVIPFGPQHPVLPEPIHLDLVVEDEKVIEAIPSLGFIHRGLETLAGKKDYEQMVYVAERICGICSMIHGMGYCVAVEAVMGLEVPPRAQYLRVIWSELSRIHSHLLWLGLAADAAGFESLFMHCWRVREYVLDIVEETTGGRVIFDASRIGGVRKDIANEDFPRLLAKLDETQAGYREIARVFESDYSMRSRFEGVGRLDRATAYTLGAVGPTARGSGVGQDMRKLGYAAYDKLAFEPVVEPAGDAWARCKVRVREVDQAFDLIRQAAAALPEGPIVEKPKGFPKGEYFARLEQPRGEVIYYVRGNGTKNLDRFRVRTPTFANIAPMVKMLEGCDLADVPVIVLSVDPCISCAER